MFGAIYSGYSGATGAFSSAVIQAGPLNAGLANFTAGKVNSFSVQTTPIVSANSTGAI